MPNKLINTVFTDGDRLYTRTSVGTLIPLKIHRTRWRMLKYWVALFTLITFAILGFVRHQQQSIQDSRVTSCVRTYGSFNEVFKPFFPAPDKRTKRQRRDLRQLHARVKALQARCDRQVKGG